MKKQKRKKPVKLIKEQQYYITASGIQSCYYTLYFRETLRKNCKQRHIATLSTDLKTSKQKAKERLGFIPEIIGEPNNKIGESFTFGKYKGRKFKDILKENKQYLIWAVENINPEMLEYDITKIKAFLEQESIPFNPYVNEDLE